MTDEIQCVPPRGVRQDKNQSLNFLQFALTKTFEDHSNALVMHLEYLFPAASRICGAGFGGSVRRQQRLFFPSRINTIHL